MHNKTFARERANPKVLWLTSSYPRYDGDSASVFLRLLATAVQREGYEIHVLAPDHCIIKQAIRDRGVRVHHFRYFSPRAWQKLAYGSGILPNLRTQPWLYLQIPFFLLAMGRATWRMLDRLKPELIHAHWVFPQGAIAVLWGKLFNVPVIITTHGGDVFALQGSLLNWIKRWSIKNCAAWTSNTRATADAAGPGLPAGQVIPMGIDRQKFQSGNPGLLSLSKKSYSAVLLSVGRLVEKKGLSDLLKAFAMLPVEWQDKAILWIIGDGRMRSALEKQASALGIDHKVVFWGRLVNDQLPDYYACADIFIAPSIIDSSGDTEGQGVVLLEALASKTAVIATRTGGIEEVITHGETGILTEPNQPEQLSNAMVYLLENQAVREMLINKGADYVRSYDWNIIGKKFADFYTNTKSAVLGLKSFS